MMVTLDDEQAEQVTLIAADLDLDVETVLQHLLSGPLMRHIGIDEKC